jgi:hypothetical protein
MLLGRETAVRVAARQVPGMQALPPEQALIAEARARARRRRRKIALAVTAVAALLSAAGVLIAPTVLSKPHPVEVVSVGPGPAIRTGTVVGHLDACYGLPQLPGRPLPVTPGTVTAVRGTVSWKPAGPGTWREIMPNGPVLAKAHISDNYHQVFRFALPPGKYLLIGRYDGSRNDGVSYPGHTTVTEVSVSAGTTLHADLPNDCK